ncbi:MAG: prepilin peptidase [Actinobacteria bacterium]|nr:prepilin peptidase [Actinomycetota bacterium]
MEYIQISKIFLVGDGLFYVIFLVCGFIAGYFLDTAASILEYTNEPSLKSSNPTPSYIHPHDVKIEVLTSLLLCANYFHFHLGIGTLNGIILSFLLIVISIVDLDIRIIPNLIIFPFTIIGLLLNIIRFFPHWWKPLSFSFGAFLFMLIIHFIYPKGMGMGDVKLALMIGSYLTTYTVIALPLGFLIFSIYGLVLIIMRKAGLKDAVPFAPFVSLGSLIALFWGDYILKWYISF